MTLGPDHSSVLSTTSSLALIYLDQGKREEAAAIYQQVLIGYVKILGPNDDLTISTARNLGYFYKQ